jgi:hypothetical protein
MVYSLFADYLYSYSFKLIILEWTIDASVQQLLPILLQILLVQNRVRGVLHQPRNPFVSVLPRKIPGS